MKLKLKGINEYKNLEIIYETKHDFITCKIIVYAVIEGKHFETNDVELEFFLLDKITNRHAFKEFYEKLFGTDSYEIYCNKLHKLAEETAKAEFINGKFQ